MADNAISRLAPRKRNALEDLTQGVSKGFWADGIGGPVDLITTLANLGIAGGGYAGHKLGLLSQPPELIQNPVGGSEWIAQKMRANGLLNDNPGSTADNYGRVAGGLLAPLTQARAPQIANALQQAPAALQRGAYAVGEKAAGMAENQLVKQGGILPATVWHGSPHKFDKFDAGKIGTGEGAQAYGHGLYLAESPDVAKSYQERLTDPAFKYAGMNEAKARLNEKIAARVEATDPARAAALRAEVASLGEAGGSLYKVDLPDEHIAKMLDWDKPLSQQPVVRQAMRADPYLKPLADMGFPSPQGIQTMTGEQVVSQLGLYGKTHAEDLRRAGIPGIRYLDQGSRAPGWSSLTAAQLDARVNALKSDISSGGGDQAKMISRLKALENERANYREQTSNFVVFPGNEGLLSILERNGQPLK